MNRRLHVVPERHATARVIETSVGALTADNLIDALRSESVTIDAAWLSFVQVAAREGWRSEACRAFVLTLAKRAAAE